MFIAKINLTMILTIKCITKEFTMKYIKQSYYYKNSSDNDFL